MRIIKEGQLPETKKHVFTCTNCKCQFEAIRSECTYNDDQRDGAFLSITCPTTGCHKGCTARV